VNPLKNVIPNVKLIASFKILILCFLLSGCAVRSVYIPVSQNTPLFGKDKALQANAFVGANHIELQVAHNPFKKVAVCGNINFGTGISIYDLALGTYGHGSNSNWRYETFVGYGYNSNFAFQTANYNVLLNQSVKNYEVRSLYQKIYLQPAVGYFNAIKMYKMTYSFSLSARLSALYFSTYSFKEIDDTASTNSGKTVYIKNVNYTNKFLYTIEPCFTNKIGVKNIYALLQFQAIIPYSDQINIRNTVFSQNFIFSLGIQYNFIFKPKKVVQAN
jgi:hypothetical protein